MARRVNGGIGIGFEEDGYFDEVGGSHGIASSSSPLPPLSEHIAVNSSPSSASAGAGDLSCIVHPVSKFDTLAGVAIKYGVEVADVKRINGLVSDLQMFALKTLQIPLPGRHLPSPMQSSSFDGQGESSSEKTPCSRHSDLFNTFQSLKLKSSSDISPSTSSLQKPILESFENVYRNGGDHYLQDVPFAKPSTPKPPVGLHRKTKSLANGFMSQVDLSGDEYAKGSRDDDSDKWMKRMHVRRRQKSEADFNIYTRQMLVKEENSSGGSFSAIVFKGLGLTPKSTNQFLSGADSEAGQQNPISAGLGDSFIANIVNDIRKSSSTSNMQESDNSTLLSLWPASKWSLKPDLNALANAAIARPIFDGITNPISGRKNKAAVD